MIKQQPVTMFFNWSFVENWKKWLLQMWNRMLWWAESLQVSWTQLLVKFWSSNQPFLGNNVYDEFALISIYCSHAQRTIFQTEKNHLEVDRGTLLWRVAFSAHGSTTYNLQHSTVLNPELAKHSWLKSIPEVGMLTVQHSYADYPISS